MSIKKVFKRNKITLTKYSKRTILYSNETESEVRRMKDKKIARKSQIMYFRAKDVMILLTYKKDTKRQNTHQKQEAT